MQDLQFRNKLQKSTRFFKIYNQKTIPMILSYGHQTVLDFFNNVAHNMFPNTKAYKDHKLMKDIVDMLKILVNHSVLETKRGDVPLLGEIYRKALDILPEGLNGRIKEHVNDLTKLVELENTTADFTDKKILLRDVAVEDILIEEFATLFQQLYKSYYSNRPTSARPNSGSPSSVRQITPRTPHTPTRSLKTPFVQTPSPLEIYIPTPSTLSPSSSVDSTTSTLSGNAESP